MDWMIQVFRVFKKSTPETFFLSASILNRYLNMKLKMGTTIETKDLYLYGLVIIFMASKLEDIRPIILDELYNEAGHKLFSKEQIVKAEQEILRTLNFRILDSKQPSLY